MPEAFSRSSVGRQRRREPAAWEDYFGTGWANFLGAIWLVKTVSCTASTAVRMCPPATDIQGYTYKKF